MGVHPSHQTRISDASSFDEICVNCGAHDEVPGGFGNLEKPCTKPQSSRPEEDYSSPAKSLARYQVLAARTINAEQNPPENLCNYVLGLVGEAGEVAQWFLGENHWEILNFEPLEKELGDVLWYVAGCCTVLSLELVDLPLGPKLYLKDELSIRLSIECGKVAEVLKKVRYHGKPLAATIIKSHLGEILSLLYQICNSRGINFNRDVAEPNIEKLKARYPDGFKTEAK